jgi:hypothetical protein
MDLIEQFAHQKEEKKVYLPKLLETEKVLNERIKKEIAFSKAIIFQGDKPIIFPRTINVIQGQAGVHKSRFAELLCSVLLKKSGCNTVLLNFIAEWLIDFLVCVVDTERNKTEQLPYALQSIKERTGYQRDEDLDIFKFTSLIDIPRKERFEALKEFLTHLRHNYKDKHIFILLDVVTDCVEDFNRTDYSMQLIDMMNEMINEFDVTFLCLIHENPKTDKARGHLGTELMNKYLNANRL